MKNSKRVVLWSSLSVVLILLIANLELIVYGIDQAKGQFYVMWNAKPIAEVLADPDFPDSLKQTLSLVDEIKGFSIDSLGLNPTRNYTKVFDQKGEDILWVVSACEPYKFEPRTWSFPIIGSFTYKGFFNLEDGLALAKELKAEGLDVHMRSVSGWSTLGWFRDPILSNMLADGPGELANTLIHELTHSTIFIPDSMTFNENLATFIGNKGAEEYLKFKFGENSEVYQDYLEERLDSKIFTTYLVQSAHGLDSLYNAIDDLNDSIKSRRKAIYIEDIMIGLDSLPFYNKLRYKGLFDKYRPNNAFFIAFLNYRERQSDFDIMFSDSLNSDVKKFIKYWQKSYGI